jgi:hypothetical protein
MAKMKAVGATEANLIHREIDAALKVIAEKYGLLSLLSGTMTYDRDGMFFKLSIEGKVNPVDDNGVMTKAAAESSTAYILKSLGTPLNAKTFIEGELYTVIGYNSRRKKNPIDLMNVRRKTMANAGTKLVKDGIERYATIQARQQQQPG